MSDPREPAGPTRPANGPRLTRRPIRARDTRWAAAIARRLAAAGLKPNQISVLSVVVAGMSAACLAASRAATAPAQAALFVGAAAFIQLRLLCNLFDGMVAVEGGLKSKSGEIYNELPDRLSDALVLAAAGYAHPTGDWAPALGWAAAVLAVITAYVRTLGAAAGAAQVFIGPMAKQQRMFLVTLACLAAAISRAAGRTVDFFSPALAIIAAGCVVTIARRTRRIVGELESK